MRGLYWSAVVVWCVVPKSITQAEEPVVSEKHNVVDDLARSNDCGPHCVWYFLQRMGRTEVTLQDVLREMNAGESYDGVSLLEIKDVLKSHRLEVNSAKIASIDQLKGDSPVILHLKHPLDVGFRSVDDSRDSQRVAGHFVVWAGRNGAFCRIWDGPLGVRTVSSRDLNAASSGFVLLSDGGDTVPPDDGSKDRKPTLVALVFALLGVTLIWRGLRWSRSTDIPNYSTSRESDLPR